MLLSICNGAENPRLNLEVFVLQEVDVSTKIEPPYQLQRCTSYRNQAT